jgi:hypothetical protein
MNPPTRKILQIISFCGLVLSILPAFLVYSGAFEKQTYLNLMLLGMLLWFGTAIFWVKKDHLS